jgi:hypothetical protein
MYICYLDESGCTGALPSADSSIQPVFVPSAVFFEQTCLQEVTLEFLTLKSRFFPSVRQGRDHYLDVVLHEVKGSDLRKEICSSARRKRTHAIGFLDAFLTLLEKHGARIIGRVYVKGIGHPLGGRALYTSSVQAICAYFQHFLSLVDDLGVIIADSRSKPQNAVVSHSIFTRKFMARGDSYTRIVEMPTYGHSENHVGLQIADLLCSGLLYPLAVHTYCSGYLRSPHLRPGYSLLKYRYGERLRSLQYRFYESGRMKGGITVSDRLGERNSSWLFTHVEALEPASRPQDLALPPMS